MNLRNVVLGFLFVAGCSNTPSVADGIAELGITQFETQETSTTLSIVGYNTQHSIVGEITLRRGHVEIPDEQLAGEGRELSINVDGKQADHKSVGTQPVSLPLMPAMSRFNAFVVDSHVAPVLAKWGVSFEMQKGEAEHAYGSPACGHTTNAACGATDCQANSDDTYEQVCCGSNGDNAGDPAYVVRTCSTPFGTSGCGTNGPGGCAPCFNYRYYSSCTLFVYPDVNLDSWSGNCTNDSQCHGETDCSYCGGSEDSNGYYQCQIQGC